MVKRQFPLILFSIIAVLTFLVIKPFITSILFAAVLSYVFYPLNDWLKRKLKGKNRAALITTILILLIAIVPTIFVAKSLISETYSTYILAKQKIVNVDLCQNGEGFICGIVETFEKEIIGQDFNQYLKGTVENFSSKAITGLYNFVRGIAESALKIFMFVILTFFFLRDGKELIKRIYNLIPFKKKERDRTIKEVSNILHAVVYGSIIISIVQGILAFFGFWIFGVTNPLLWGLIVMFASFVPFLGATLGWLPVSLVYLADAFVSAEGTGILKGILLLVYCGFIVSGIDNFLKPKIIGDRTKLHPAFVFLGVAGGLYLLGPIGVFIGPVIMALLVVIVRIYEDYQTK